MGKRSNLGTKVPVIQYQRLVHNSQAFGYRYNNIHAVAVIPLEMAQFLASQLASELPESVNGLLYPGGVDWQQWAVERSSESIVRPSLMFAMERGDGQFEMMGGAWVEDSRMTSDNSWAGEMAMAILPGWREYSFICGRLAIEWGFREVMGLTSLYSFVHAGNRKSVWFMGQLGFEISKPMPGFSALPGRSHRAHLASLTRRHWDRMNLVEMVEQKLV